MASTQCSGIEYPMPEARTWPENERISLAEEVIANMPKRPEIMYGGGQPRYNIVEDKVYVPVLERFESSGEYYSALFHELTHSSGHANRLARDMKAHSFGDNAYSREELVAEMGAAFLCSHCGIENTIQNSAAYLQGWIKALKGDNKLAIKAAADAQKAANFILGVKPVTA